MLGWIKCNPNISWFAACSLLYLSESAYVSILACHKLQLLLDSYFVLVKLSFTHYIPFGFQSCYMMAFTSPFWSFKCHFVLVRSVFFAGNISKFQLVTQAGKLRVHCCVLLVDQVVDLAPGTWPDAARTCKLEPVMIWGSRSSNVLSRWLGALSPWHWSRCFQRKERTPPKRRGLSIVVCQTSSSSWLLQPVPKILPELDVWHWFILYRFM